MCGVHWGSMRVLWDGCLDEGKKKNFSRGQCDGPFSRHVSF